MESEQLSNIEKFQPKHTTEYTIKRMCIYDTFSNHYIEVYFIISFNYFKVIMVQLGFSIYINIVYIRKHSQGQRDAINLTLWHIK